MQGTLTTAWKPSLTSNVVNLFIRNSSRVLTHSAPHYQPPLPFFPLYRTMFSTIVVHYCCLPPNLLTETACEHQRAQPNTLVWMMQFLPWKQHLHSTLEGVDKANGQFLAVSWLPLQLRVLQIWTKANVASLLRKKNRCRCPFWEQALLHTFLQGVHHHIVHLSWPMGALSSDERTSLQRTTATVHMTRTLNTSPSNANSSSLCTALDAQTFQEVKETLNTTQWTHTTAQSLYTWSSARTGKTELCTKKVQGIVVASAPLNAQSTSQSKIKPLNPRSRRMSLSHGQL